MLSVANSRTRLPVQFVFAITNGIGALLGRVYSHLTPDVYDKQKHSPVGWFGIVFSLFWLVMTFIPKSNVDKQSYSKNFHSNQRSCEALLQSSHPSSFELEQEYQDDELHSPMLDDADETDERLENGRRFHHFTTNAIFPRAIAWMTSKSSLQALQMLRAIFDRSILVLGFICLVTGVVVFSGSFVSRFSTSKACKEMSLTHATHPARQERVQWPCTFNQGRDILLVRSIDLWSLAWLSG